MALTVSQIAQKWLIFSKTYASNDYSESEEFWPNIYDENDEEPDKSGKRIKSAIASIPPRLSETNHEWIYFKNDCGYKAHGTETGHYFLNTLRDQSGNCYHITLQPESLKNDTLATFHLTTDYGLTQINKKTGKKSSPEYALHKQNGHLYFEVTLKTEGYCISVEDFYKVKGVHNSERCSDYRLKKFIVPMIYIMDILLNEDN